MTSIRKTSLIAGVIYVITFASIPTLTLYRAIHDPNYVMSDGPDSDVITGAILEIIVAMGCVGTAVVLYPVLKKQNQAMALGFVGSRIVEAGTIIVGVASLLTIVGLRQSGVGPEAVMTGRALVMLYDKFFLVGQSLMPAVNDVLLGLLLYQSRLVPRSLSVIGIVGGPILLSSDVGVLFGIIGQRDPLAMMSAIPVALFEITLGILLIFNGFSDSNNILRNLISRQAQ